jgi:hypothetical protein
MGAASHSPTAEPPKERSAQFRLYQEPAGLQYLGCPRRRKIPTSCCQIRYDRQSLPNPPRQSAANRALHEESREAPLREKNFYQ